MNPDWNQVEAHLAAVLLPPDEALESALRASEAAGMPAHHVSALEGRMLQILAAAVGARRILEIGTLGGYSAICLGRALPAGGRLVTLELDPRHASVARENLSRAGLSDRVEVRVGDALESLAALEASGEEPFDFVFVDADKASNVAYLRAALRLSRVGALIVVDNVVRGGEVANPETRDPSVMGTRALLEEISANPRLLGTALQTVGAKGHDGFAILWVQPG